ncbi:hypothetical protein V6N13_023628 [Hibiscus sabdariffa]
MRFLNSGLACGCTLLFLFCCYVGIQTSKVAERIAVVEYHREDSEMPETNSDRQRRGDRESAFYLFTQQRLPACKPVLTPPWVSSSFLQVITIYLLIGFIFVPVGLVTLRASHSVVEIEERYDIECVPESSRIDKVSYIQDDSIPKNCSLLFKTFRTMSGQAIPSTVLSRSSQRITLQYVRSRSDQQLLHGRNSRGTSTCQPVESSNNRTIVPCGLIAWSLFNDTFTFIRGKGELKVNRTNIAWKSDRDHKFGKNVYPYNFQNGTWIGGGKLNPRIPLSDQEDLIVWMRIAALPSFRKLYGRIEEDLDVGDYVNVKLMNNYNTYSFGGKKKLVLSTSNWLGGKNDFLALAYVFVGSSSLTIAIVFLLLHLYSRRGWTSDFMEEVRHPVTSSSGNFPCLVLVMVMVIKMMKEMGCKQNWGAVAPARLVSTRKSSISPRLETILEEGCENHAAFTKKILLYLPVVLSTVFYFLVYNGVTRCA